MPGSMASLLAALLIPTGSVGRQRIELVLELFDAFVNVCEILLGLLHPQNTRGDDGVRYGWVGRSAGVT